MDFYKRMEKVCHIIPYGKVATYGQIAMLCGKPRNARQVGYALSHGRVESGIPAWRLVNSSGFLSGAAYFEYPEMQRLLLTEEGVKQGGFEKIRMEKFTCRSAGAEKEI